MFLPAAAPVANQVLQSDGSGNLTWTRGLIPLGTVIATFPNLTGAYSTANTTAADANGYVLCAGQTISDASSPMNTAVIPNINNSVFLQGSATAGGTGGANSTTLTTTQLPAHTHGAGSYAESIGVTNNLGISNTMGFSNNTLAVSDTIGVTGGTASLTGTTSFASTTHTHVMSHYHQVLYNPNGNQIALTTGSTSQGTFTTGTAITTYSASYAAGGNIAAFQSSLGVQCFSSGSLGQPGGTGASAATGTPSATATVGISSTGASKTGSAVLAGVGSLTGGTTITGTVSTTGSNSVTGTSGSTGTGSAYDSRPNYINAVYLMRIK